MKLKNNLIRSITSVCAALIIFVSCFCVPVLAADSNVNNFIDFNEYATYSYSDDGTSVIADVDFPDFFNNTFVAFGGREYWFTGNTFSVDYTYSQNLKIRMYPISGYTNDNMGVGVQLSDTNILDLRYIPNGSTLNYSFSVGLSTDDRAYYEGTKFFRAFYFVDENGSIIADRRHYFYPELSRGIYTWSESYTLDIPSGAVGLIPQFWISELPCYEDSCTFVLSPFQFVLPMSALEFDSMQNQQIKDTLKSVENALADQGEKIDSMISGTPAQNQQAQDAVNGLNNSTDKLGDLGDQMASVEKPSIDSSKISADSLVPQTSLVVLSSPFQALWENKQLLAMLSIVVTLVLVSWVFFGKKA